MVSSAVSLAGWSMMKITIIVDSGLNRFQMEPFIPEDRSSLVLHFGPGEKKRFPLLLASLKVYLICCN